MQPEKPQKLRQRHVSEPGYQVVARALERGAEQGLGLAMEIGEAGPFQK